MFKRKNQNQGQGATSPAPHRSFVWGKVAGMFFAVLVPGCLLAYANAKVFPESTWLATGMVIITIGIAGCFAVASGYAMAHVRRYCLFAHLFLCVVMAANLVCHWVLAREVSAVRQSTVARHEEEDRAEARRRAAVEDAQRLIAAQKELTEANARQLRMEAVRNDSARRLGVAVPRAVRPSSSALAPTVGAVIPEVPKPIESGPVKTLDQVMDEWYWWLIGFAAAELLASIVAFGVCALLWEWDVKGDGIADHLQQPVPVYYQTPASTTYVASGSAPQSQVPHQTGNGRSPHF
jgi:hypothetical protein